MSVVLPDVVARPELPGTAVMPPDGDALLATTSDAITGSARGVVPGPHPMVAVVFQLADQHQRQWAAETACRAAREDNDAIAAAKRRIDQLNGLRVACIDEIDGWCERHMPPGPTGVPIHTETVGCVIDRIVIATVRAHNLACELGADSGPALSADAQLRGLVDAYGTLLAEVAARRRRVPFWRSLKHYQAVPR